MNLTQALWLIALIFGLLVPLGILLFLPFLGVSEKTKEGWLEYKPQRKHQWAIKLHAGFYVAFALFLLYLMYLVSLAEIQKGSWQMGKILIYSLFAGIVGFICWTLYHVYRLYQTYRAYETDSYLLISYSNHCFRYVKNEKVYEVHQNNVKSLTRFCFAATHQRSPLTDFERFEFELTNRQKFEITNWLMDTNSHVLSDVLGRMADRTVTGVKGLYLVSF